MTQINNEKEGEVMIKKFSKYNVITRPMIIAFLAIISIVMTTGTFAYWAIEVESADMSTQEFIQVGTQLEGTSWYDVIDEEVSCDSVDEFLIPHDQLIDSEIDEYEIIYNVCGIDELNSNQSIDVSYEFIIYKNGKLANDNFYNELMRYINIELSNIDSENNGTGNVAFSYILTIDEDLPNNIINKFSKAEIQILLDYDVN